MATTAREKDRERGLMSGWRRPSDRRGKSLSVLAAERFRVARRCSRWASCPFAICETVLYDGSGFLAYGRRGLPPPVRVAGVPTISPCLDYTGSGHPECEYHLYRCAFSALLY